jgi:ankyrin repeat protein
MLSILYRNGADIFINNRHQQSLLHIVALAAEFYNNINNAKSTIRFLLDHGMNINGQDVDGNTMLMLLCGIHKPRYKVDDRNIASLVYAAIKFGAAAAITNNAGKSALDAVHHHRLQQTKGVLMNALSWNDQ